MRHVIIQYSTGRVRGFARLLQAKYLRGDTRLKDCVLQGSVYCGADRARGARVVQGYGCNRVGMACCPREQGQVFVLVGNVCQISLPCLVRPISCMTVQRSFLCTMTSEGRYILSLFRDCVSYHPLSSFIPMFAFA